MAGRGRRLGSSRPAPSPAPGPRRQRRQLHTQVPFVAGPARSPAAKRVSGLVSRAGLRDARAARAINNPPPGGPGGSPATRGRGAGGGGGRRETIKPPASPAARVLPAARPSRGPACPVGGAARRGGRTKPSGRVQGVGSLLPSPDRCYLLLHLFVLPALSTPFLVQVGGAVVVNAQFKTKQKTSSLNILIYYVLTSVGTPPGVPPAAHTVSGPYPFAHIPPE